MKFSGEIAADGVEAQAGGAEGGVEDAGGDDVGFLSPVEGAVADGQEGIGGGYGLGGVVGGEEDGMAAVGEGAEEPQDVNAACYVEEGGGFVEDDERCLLGECPGYHGLLPLSVAEGAAGL